MPSPRPLALTALAVVLASALAGCQRTPTPAGETRQADAATAPAANATGAVSGIDLAGIDKSVQPGDDFNAYANGAWEKSARIPDDRSSTGAFVDVFELAEKRTADLIQGLGKTDRAADGDARRIADYYAAYMDEAGIEQRGLAPLQPVLDEIDAIDSVAALSRYIGGSVRADTDPLNYTSFHTGNLFGVFVARGLEGPPRNVATLMQGGLGMPDREYYLSGAEAMAKNREAYRTYIAALLGQAGTPDAEGKAKAIFDLEMKIAKAHASVVDSQDVHKGNNPWDTAALATRAPGLDWKAFLDAAGLSGEKTIVAWQPDAIRGLSALVASQPLQAWKDYLRFHALDHSASLLPRACADLHFGFHGKTLQGTPQQKDRWKRAVESTSKALGDAVGKRYAEQYFPPSSKAQVEQMVHNILAAFRDGVDRLDWMSPETKKLAKAKAETMRVSVGYPDTWRDYASLEIRRDDPLGNALRAEEYEYRYQLSKLGKDIDPGEWWMTPQTVNAIQLPLQNAMNFPAAILEAPFFDPKADPAANYGAIGAVIGHEISHGFDNTGAEFGADGQLHNWWTPEDSAHFKAAAERLVKQYDAYEPLPGLHINGEQTLGENIADVSGLQAAYRAWRASLDGREPPVIDGLTGDQRFFLAFGQVWRTKMREPTLRSRVIGDVHAPGAYRALTVRNIDPWYEAFDVEAGQKLYLAPDARVRIW
jgi:putative endopeptidase